MPTRRVLPSFWRDWDRLTPQQQRAFREAVENFIGDLAKTEQGFHPRLRIKRMQGHPGVWEMSWAPDGRATFEYGDEIHPGEAHIICVVDPQGHRPWVGGGHRKRGREEEHWLAGLPLGLAEFFGLRSTQADRLPRSKGGDGGDRHTGELNPDGGGHGE
jgi:hypothetical protein